MRFDTPKIASSLISALAQTWRIHAPKYHHASAVIAFWHDEMLPAWKFFAKTNAVGMTSLSKDGDILAELLKKWSFTVVRGSSSKGGKEALDALTHSAEKAPTLITPDGPRGPRHEFKAGAVIAAWRAGVPLLLLRVESGGFRLEKSWDKFLVPYPFARIHIHFSAPIVIPQSADRERIGEIIRECERVMNLPIAQFLDYFTRKNALS